MLILETQSRKIEGIATRDQPRAISIGLRTGLHKLSLGGFCGNIYHSIIFFYLSGISVASFATPQPYI